MMPTRPRGTEERLDVSIVFTQWNVREMLRNCLHSVREKTTGLSYEIIIVDDGSTDGSAAMVREEFPEVTLLVNETNIGVAKSYNKGVASARGRYVQMLNTDMLLVNNAVKILMDFLESHPRAAACCGKLLNPDTSPQVSYGSFPSLKQAFVEATGLPQLLPWISWPVAGVLPDKGMTEPIEAEYLSGADMMIRADVINRLGFLDERYTSYCEETDFCYRVLHETQLKLYYVPEAEIIHFGGQSFSAIPEYRYRLMYSGYNKFLTKHHGRAYALLTRILYALKGVRRWLTAAVKWVVAPNPGRKAMLRQAAWEVKYSLVPQEGRL